MALKVRLAFSCQKKFLPNIIHKNHGHVVKIASAAGLAKTKGSLILWI